MIFALLRFECCCLESQTLPLIWSDAPSQNPSIDVASISLYGSVDDIWLDTKNNSLILVDYKSQANENKVSQETYWNGDFKTGYQRQLDFYFYLLKQQNFKETISDDAYLLVVNARGLEDKFDNKLLFESTLIHTKVKDDYLENEIQEMIDVFNSHNIPESNKLCKNCAYARQRSIIDKLWAIIIKSDLLIKII